MENWWARYRMKQVFKMKLELEKFLYGRKSDLGLNGKLTVINQKSDQPTNSR